MELFTVEQAVQLALNEAENKNKKGLLIPCSEIPEDPEFGFWSTTDGDKESVYSLESLYSQYTVDNEAAANAIHEALLGKYPTYF
jgi:hypothetical protein